MHPFHHTVGLFGTCGKSTWRSSFIEAFDRIKVPYFNPQVPNWNPELAQLEAEHLANDGIILFPVTDETTAFGSLAETGSSILSAVKSLDDAESVRFLIIYIDPTCKVDDPAAKKDSERARALVLAHLKKLSRPNILIVHSLEELRQKAIEAHHLLQAWSHWRNADTTMKPQLKWTVSFGRSDIVDESKRIIPQHEVVDAPTHHAAKKAIARKFGQRIAYIGSAKKQTP